jgi:hypothetical protein
MKATRRNAITTRNDYAIDRFGSCGNLPSAIGGVWRLFLGGAHGFEWVKSRPMSLGRIDSSQFVGSLRLLFRSGDTWLVLSRVFSPKSKF